MELSARAAERAHRARRAMAKGQAAVLDEEKEQGWQVTPSSVKSDGICCCSIEIADEALRES